MISVACYCRVSTEEQAREGYSISAQRDRLVAFCRAQEWSAVDIYIDEGESGAKIDRPELNRLQQDAKDGKFNLVLVWKVDRLSRKVAHLAQLVEELDRQGIAFRSVTEPFDTSHAAGRAFMQMLGVFAELERENIRERSRLGIRKRVQEGYLHGRPVMIGYSNTDKGKWEIDPEGAEVVHWIFDQYLSGIGPFRMAQMLKKGSIPGLSAQVIKEEFSQAKFLSTVDRIRWIIKNPVYAGYAPLGDELYKGRHEAIIDPKTWRKVNALMESRYNVPNRAHTTRYLLSGRVVCGLCGANMYGFRQPNPSSTKDVRPYLEYYVCSNSTAGRGKMKTCTNWGVKREVAEGAALDAIRDLALSTNLDSASLPQPDLELQGRRRSIMSSLTQLERSQRKWFDAFEQSPDLEDVALDRIRVLGERQRELTKELAETEKKIRLAGSPLDKDEVESYLRDVGAVINHADPDQLREIIRSLVKKVIVTPTQERVRGNFVKRINVEFYPL